MEITIFAKKRTTKDGKPFTGYLSTLRRKDGTEQLMAVKFRDECGSPKAEDCPCNIEIERDSANIVVENYTRKDGEPATSYTLWVSKWSAGTPYVDHSLDEFDV